MGLAIVALACTAAGHGGQSHRQPLWYDDFAHGQPHWAQWSRCAQPWDDKLAQCSALVAGPGEQVYWSPSLMHGGRDPVVAAPDGGIRIIASPMTDTESTLLTGVMARQPDLAPRARAVLTAARWTSGWMQTRASFGVGTTVTATIRPGAGASSWSGLWMLNDPAHRRWPPEIDVGEVTNDADGRMRVRQVIHYRDDTGAMRASACPVALMARDWITVSVTRIAGEIRFSLNGVERCRVPAPKGFDDPMNLILSQQVGGLAAHSDATTAPFSLDVRRIEVTRP